MIWSRDESSKTFGNLVKKHDAVRWDNMSEDKLAELYAALEEKEAAKLREMEDLQTTLQEDLSRNDVAAFERHQRRLPRLEADYRALKRKKSTIYKARQDVIVRTRVERDLNKKVARRLEQAILALIVVVLLILSFQLLYPDLLETLVDGKRTATRLAWTLFLADASACVVFWFEFFMRLAHAEDKKWFWRSNWIDLASSIPIPPYFWILNGNIAGRMLRLVRILRIWRAFRIVSFLWRGMERLNRLMDVRLMKKSMYWVGGIIFFGAIGVHLIETSGAGIPVEPQRAQAASYAPFTGNRAQLRELRAQAEVPIGGSAFQLQQVNAQAATSPAERSSRCLGQVPRDRTKDKYFVATWCRSLWWSFNTVATGGYGDLYVPKHWFAQFITAIMMIAGLVVMGVFIATLSSAYRGESHEKMDEIQREMRRELGKLVRSQSDLANKLTTMEQSLARGR